MACHLQPIFCTWDAVTTCTLITVFFPLVVQLFEKKASIQGHCRAIDTSEVSLVQIANYPLARQTPTQDPHAVTHMAGDMLKLVRWLPSLQNDLFRVFLSTTFHFSKQIISLDGCRRLESQNQCCMTQWTEKVDMYTYETVLSGL